MEVVGRSSASRCHSSALSNQTAGSYRPGSPFLFDYFRLFLNTSLTKFSLVLNNLSSAVGITLNSR